MSDDERGGGLRRVTRVRNRRGETALHSAAARGSLRRFAPAAVAAATSLAEPGDAVVLSPGCASFDWYASYSERGDDFASCVRARADFEEPT